MKAAKILMGRVCESRREGEVKASVSASCQLGERQATFRHWLKRLLAEVLDDTRHLQSRLETATSLVDRPPMSQDIADAVPEYRNGCLEVNGQQLMQVWEEPLMRSMVGACECTNARVLEIGYGLGIAARLLQSMSPLQHCIIEVNPHIAKQAENWQTAANLNSVQIVHADWRDQVSVLKDFDVVFFDSYPRTEQEARENVGNARNIAEEFFPYAKTVLRADGRMVFYSNEADSLSRRMQRTLLEHFFGFRVSICKELCPPSHCNYWRDRSMLVVVAYSPFKS